MLRIVLHAILSMFFGAVSYIAFKNNYYFLFVLFVVFAVLNVFTMLSYISKSK